LLWQVTRQHEIPGAKDVWYWGASGRFQLAAQGSYRIAENIELGLRAGVPLSERLNSPQVPAFVVVAAAYRL